MTQRSRDSSGARDATPVTENRHGQGQNELNQEVALRVKVAELCGWKPYPHNTEGDEVYCNPLDPTDEKMPDYCNDLNAMHEAESAAFTDDDPLLLNQWAYECYMIGRANAEDKDVSMLRLTAPQRAEAFVKTMEARSVGDGTEKHLAAPGSPKSASSSGSASMEGANKDL